MKYVLVAWMMILGPVAAFAREEPARPRVGIVEKLGETIPLDEQFYDESGHLVQLRSLLDKPTLLVFVYFRCPGICTPLLNEITKVVRKMTLVPGKDYRIITLSFDPTETPDLAADKKESYLAEFPSPIDPAGWRFLTGDSASIHRLTDACGFTFEPAGHDWVHPTGLIAVSPSGKITRYLYGINQLPLDVTLALTEASEGKTGPTIAKVLNFCYSYDPAGKRYAFDVVRISGIVIAGLVAVFVVVFVVRPRKQKTPPAEPPAPRGRRTRKGGKS